MNDEEIYEMLKEMYAEKAFGEADSCVRNGRVFVNYHGPSGTHLVNFKFGDEGVAINYFIDLYKRNNRFFNEGDLIIARRTIMQPRFADDLERRFS